MLSTQIEQFSLDLDIELGKLKAVLSQKTLYLFGRRASKPAPNEVIFL